MRLSVSTLFLFSILLFGMIGSHPINFGSQTESGLSSSNYLISAFAEDGEDNTDEGTEDATSGTNGISSANSTSTETEDDVMVTKDNTDDETEDATSGTNGTSSANSTSTETEDDMMVTKDNTDDETEDNTDDETEDKTKDNTDNETEIEVEVKNDKTKVKISLDGDEYRFVVNDVSESAIIDAIMAKTGLTEDEIRATWDFQTESDSDKDNSQTSEQILKHENKAKDIADATILQLQQKIDQLEERLQNLLNKFETGAYFGTVTNADTAPDSYSVSFDGSATSLDDNSIASDVNGNIYLESITTGTDSFKLRVTGGEILVGDTFYDFVFGKARLSSSDDGTSMIILGQIMDDQGDVHTLRLTLDTATALTGDFGSEPVPFEIDPSNSKIAKQWALDASGNFSLLS